MAEHESDTKMEENTIIVYAIMCENQKILDKYAKCKFMIYKMCENKPEDQFVITELIKFKINVQMLKFN